MGILKSLSKRSQVILCDAGSSSDLQFPVSQSVSHTAARGIDAMPRGAVSLRYDSQQARVIKYLRLVALSAHSGMPGT